MSIKIGIGRTQIFRGGGSAIDWSSYWTPQYEAWYNAMTTKPSNQDMYWQSRMYKALVDLGLDLKAEFIDIFAMPSADASLINAADPGTFDPAAVAAPTFEAYKGYTGASAGNKCIRLHFDPTTDATLINKDNFTVIMGISTDADSNLFDFGNSDGVTQFVIRTRNGNALGMYPNDLTGSAIANTNSIGHYAMGRNNNVAGRGNKNDYEFPIGGASQAAITSGELYICGRNGYGTPEGAGKQTAYVMLFSFLTRYEINEVIVAVETYLREYGNGLISIPYIYEVTADKDQIPLTTIEGANGVTVHPSVLNLGSQWNGYQYWMANTPYTQSAEYPHIFASNDGISWVVPTGLTNPIYPQQGGGKFAPDPNLFFENNTLYCFFLYFDGADIHFCYSKSTDGINWGARVTTNLSPVTNIKSPAIIKIGADYFMYHQDDPNTLVKRYKAATLEGAWGDIETITVNGVATLGHVDIKLIGANYWLINTDASSQMALSVSSDGLTFNNAHAVIYKTEAWEAAGFYKGSLVVYNNGEIWLYCSVSSAGNTYRTERVRLKIMDV